MIVGFGIHWGDVSRTYSSDAYLDEIPAELREIGEMMAREDFVKNGPMRPGKDHVIVKQYPEPVYFGRNDGLRVV